MSRDSFPELDRITNKEACIEEVAAYQQPYLAYEVALQQPMDCKYDEKEDEEAKLGEIHGVFEVGLASRLRPFL